MFQSLSYYQKFTSGSDLWCLFFEPQRDLFKEINWRTKFLIHKLKEKIQLKKPLLIESSSFFPNQYILCLPLFLREKEYEIWLKLKQPSLRIFLPLEYKKPCLNFWFNKNLHGQKISYYNEKIK
ncbi:MAG: hypothetical protein GDA46_01715 [Bdellovibrionales bacterium]|nr:hypothetical protein [Bdellovibrionales bacterium]